MGKLDNVLGMLSDLETEVLLANFFFPVPGQLHGWKDDDRVLMDAICRDYLRRQWKEGIPEGVDCRSYLLHRYRQNLDYEMRSSKGSYGIKLSMFKEITAKLIPASKLDEFYKRSSMLACEAYIISEAVQ